MSRDRGRWRLRPARSESREGRGDSAHEASILVAWARFLGDPRSQALRNQLYALLVRWMNVQLSRVPWPLADALCDSFVDRILCDLPRRTPHLATLRAYWRHSLAEARRKAAWTRRQTYIDSETLPEPAAADAPELTQAQDEEGAALRIARTLDSLPRASRSIVRLRCTGLRFREIAARLGMSESSARSLCARARSTLALQAIAGGELPLGALRERGRARAILELRSQVARCQEGDGKVLAFAVRSRRDPASASSKIPRFLGSGSPLGRA